MLLIERQLRYSIATIVHPHRIFVEAFIKKTSVKFQLFHPDGYCTVDCFLFSFFRISVIVAASCQNKQTNKQKNIYICLLKEYLNIEGSFLSFFYMSIKAVRVFL